MRRVVVIRLALVAMVLFYFVMQVKLNASTPVDLKPSELVELPVAEQNEPQPLAPGGNDDKGLPHIDLPVEESIHQPAQSDAAKGKHHHHHQSHKTKKPHVAGTAISVTSHCKHTRWDHITVASYHDGNILSLRPQSKAGEREGRKAADYVPDGDVVMLDENDLTPLKMEKVGKDEQAAHVSTKFEVEGASKATLEARCAGGEAIGGHQDEVFRYSESVSPTKPPATIEESDDATTSAPAAWPKLAFDVTFVGRIAAGVEVRFDTANVEFYGLAMRGTSVSLPVDHRVRIKNLDLNHYDAGDATLGLYGTVPLVYAVVKGRREGARDDEPEMARTVGLFWLNGSPAHAIVHKTDRATLTFEGSSGGVRFFILTGPTPADVLSQYYRVTGKPYLPPIFGLGYQQCRWTYKDQTDVKAVSQGFDTRDIPCDAIWLDIDHTDRKRYFTWDHDRFPQPKQMQEDLWSSAGRRMVTITDPHIAIDSQYHVWDEANRGGHFIKDENGMTNFEGHCWPGASSWIDYTDPAARQWYASLFAFDKYKESTEHLFSWIDMNEPSVFSGPAITMPMSKLHAGGLKHETVHNLYGFYQSMATFEGHMERTNGRDRPFLLTRSFFAGSQRFAAVWSGDNQAKWTHLVASAFHILQMAMGGIPHVGADVGGFFDDPQHQLIVRWYQMGSLYPFYRGHSHEQTRRREPWLFSDATKIKVAAALRFRYRLLPYLYTSYWQAASGDGSGVMHPLMMKFPNDLECYSVVDTFMLGHSIIARPITDTSSHYNLYIPRNAAGKPEVLYDFWTGRKVSGPSEHVRPSPHTHGINREQMLEDERGVVPLFIRGGSIIPLKVRHAKTTEQLRAVPYQLLVAPDDEGRASGVLYLDDGVTNAHEQKSDFCVVSFTYAERKLKAVVGHQCKYQQAANGDAAATLSSVWIFGALPSDGSVTVANTINHVGKSEHKEVKLSTDSKAPLVAILEDMSLPLEVLSIPIDDTVLWEVTVPEE